MLLLVQLIDFVHYLLTLFLQLALLAFENLLRKQKEKEGVADQNEGLVVEKPLIALGKRQTIDHYGVFAEVFYDEVPKISCLSLLSSGDILNLGGLSRHFGGVGDHDFLG